MNTIRPGRFRWHRGAPVRRAIQARRRRRAVLDERAIAMPSASQGAIEFPLIRSPSTSPAATAISVIR